MHVVSLFEYNKFDEKLGKLRNLLIVGSEAGVCAWRQIFDFSSSDCVG
jgi:hypothetical protein